MVIIIEDVHDMDIASLRLFQRAHFQCPSVFLLVTMRPLVPGSSDLDRHRILDLLINGESTLHLKLGPFSLMGKLAAPLLFHS